MLIRDGDGSTPVAARVAGRWALVVYRQETYRGSGALADTTMELVDLKGRAYLRWMPLPVRPIEEPRVVRLELRPTGGFAFSVEHLNRGPMPSIYRGAIRAPIRRLDRGSDVDAASLHRVGSTIRWRGSGGRRSARLAP
jgi:hypothetical protein